MKNVLVFSGSSRDNSLNQALATLAAKTLEQAGHRVTLINLAQFDMPIFSQDIEAQGMPKAAFKFKQLLLEHDAWMIASPEYNGCFSPLLKNAIDWASRSTHDNEAPLSAFRNKKVALMATSPGALGGMRGLAMLRMLFANIGVTVLGQQLTVAKGHEQFSEGKIDNVSDALKEKMQNLIQEFMQIV